jgi:hypothetical protein
MASAPSNSQNADEQYGAFTTGGGDVVVYDTDNPEAWLQSDYAVEIGQPSERTSA